MTRLRKPRLFVQVRKGRRFKPSLFFVSEHGRWFFWLRTADYWCEGTEPTTATLLDLLRTHVEVPL